MFRFSCARRNLQNSHLRLSASASSTTTTPSTHDDKKQENRGLPIFSLIFVGSLFTLFYATKPTQSRSGGDDDESEGKWFKRYETLSQQSFAGKKYDAQIKSQVFTKNVVADEDEKTLTSRK